MRYAFQRNPVRTPEGRAATDHNDSSTLQRPTEYFHRRKGVLASMQGCVLPLEADRLVGKEQ
jgi:hypothetical protein